MANMGKEKYVAYVSAYTMGGDQYGIKIYDVDLKNGRFVVSLWSLRKHRSVATDTRSACFRRMHRKLPTHASLASDE